MQNIQEEDAFKEIESFINELEGNLLIKDDFEVPSSEAPKIEWIEPLIQELKAAILELDKGAKPVVLTPSSNVAHFDACGAAWRLISLIRELGEDLESHDSIRSDDDQYEDPQEWWLRPLIKKLKEAKSNLHFNGSFTY